jgi:hypothetical protein
MQIVQLMFAEKAASPLQSADWYLFIPALPGGGGGLSIHMVPLDRIYVPLSLFSVASFGRGRHSWPVHTKHQPNTSHIRHITLLD